MIIKIHTPDDYDERRRRSEDADFVFVDKLVESFLDDLLTVR